MNYDTSKWNYRIAGVIASNCHVTGLFAGK